MPAFFGTAGDASAQDPPTNALAVVPSDTVDLTWCSTRFYIGGAGNLAVIMAGGQSVIFTALAVGTMLNIRATRVLATGTTATNIVALWR